MSSTTDTIRSRPHRNHGGIIGAWRTVARLHGNSPLELKWTVKARLDTNLVKSLGQNLPSATVVHVKSGQFRPIS